MVCMRIDRSTDVFFVLFPQVFLCFLLLSLSLSSFSFSFSSFFGCSVHSFRLSFVQLKVSNIKCSKPRNLLYWLRTVFVETAEKFGKLHYFVFDINVMDVYGSYHAMPYTRHEEYMRYLLFRIHMQCTSVCDDGKCSTKPRSQRRRRRRRTLNVAIYRNLKILNSRLTTIKIHIFHYTVCCACERVYLYNSSSLILPFARKLLAATQSHTIVVRPIRTLPQNLFEWTSLFPSNY